MQIDETTYRIEQIVTWYHKLPKDFTGITDLMYHRVQLSTLMFYYAVELGAVRKQWKKYECETEIAKRSGIKNAMDQGNPISKSIEIGKYSCLDEYAVEKQYDGLYNSMKFVYDASTEILNTINQHISNLKKEQEQTRILK